MVKFRYWGDGFVRAVVTAMLVACLSGIVVADDEAIQLGMKQIEQSIAGQDAAGAMQQANQLVETYPDSPLALSVRAQLLLMMNNMPQGMADLNKALGLEPHHPRATALMARVEAGTGQALQARQRLDAALEVHPRSYDLLMMKAQLQAASQDPAGAIESAESAVEHAQDEEQKLNALVQLAMANAQLQKWEEAEKLMKFALTVDAGMRRNQGDQPPTQMTARLQLSLAEARMQLEDHVGAAQAYREVLAGPFGNNPQVAQQVGAKLRELEQVIEQQARAGAEARGQKLRPWIEAYRLDVNAEVDGKPVADLIADEVLAFYRESRDPDETLLKPAADAPRWPQSAMPEEVKERQQRALEKANELELMIQYQDGNFASLIEQADEVLAIYPAPEVLFQLAHAHFAKQRFDEAVRYAALTTAMVALETVESSGLPAHRIVRSAAKTRLATLAFRQLGQPVILDEDLKWVRNFFDGHASDDAMKADTALYEESPKYELMNTPEYVVVLQRLHKRVGHYEKAELARVRLLARTMTNTPLQPGDRVWVASDLAEPMLERRYLQTLAGCETLLVYLKEMGRGERYDELRDYTLSTWPFSFMPWYHWALDAEAAGDLDRAMFLYNAAVTLSGDDEVGPNNWYGSLKEQAAAKLAELEKRHGDGLMMQYVNMAYAEEDREENAEREGVDFRPATIAALQRAQPHFTDAAQLAALYGRLSYEMVNLSDYPIGSVDQFAAAIDLAQRAQQATPGNDELMAEAWGVIGDAHRKSAPRYTSDEQTKQHHWTKAIEAYDEAMQYEQVSLGDRVEYLMITGDLLQWMDRATDALPCYTWIIDHADKDDRRRAEAYYYRSKINHEHKLADIDAIRADARQAYMLTIEESGQFTFGRSDDGIRVYASSIRTHEMNMAAADLESRQ